MTNPGASFGGSMNNLSPVYKVTSCDVDSNGQVSWEGVLVETVKVEKWTKNSYIGLVYTNSRNSFTSGEVNTDHNYYEYVGVT